MNAELYGCPDIPRQVLCDIDQLQGSKCKEFTVRGSAGEPCAIFVVQTDTGWHAYQNHCPHTGVNLNWMPDQFLNLEQDMIQCATHGALFRLEDGYCIYGPCNGASLQSIALEVVGSTIMVGSDKAS
jgi:nitrite reductase/ring-hydroxylating ferredoxin subunit